MNPAKVDRARLHKLTDLPNVGKAFAGDLVLLGITSPEQLVGADPLDLYDRLTDLTGTYQDPCVLDTFMSLTRFMAGEPARPWWDFTRERKQWLRQLGR
ncbi:MAG: helix-hairpin-helix domain-containing protein [Rhodothermales bacterium]